MCLNQSVSLVEHMHVSYSLSQMITHYHKYFWQFCNTNLRSQHCIIWPRSDGADSIQLICLLSGESLFRSPLSRWVSGSCSDGERISIHLFLANWIRWWQVSADTCKNIKNNWWSDWVRLKNRQTQSVHLFKEAYMILIYIF